MKLSIYIPFYDSVYGRSLLLTRDKSWRYNFWYYPSSPYRWFCHKERNVIVLKRKGDPNVPKQTDPSVHY